jgi:uncharacterized protein YceH (UPF0502 family)
LGLSSAEIRVLGCLLEKQLTTPDIYPLTLNGLRLACNQSTNRDPVVDYDDTVLRDALHRLERRGLARMASGRGSRAPKYRHLLAQALPLNPDEHAILCVLMLRGPQTPGELKQRAGRMHAFSGLDAVHETLERLGARRLVARMDRRPGQKEERYTQLLEDRDPYADERGLAHAPALGAAAAPAPGTAPPPAPGTAPPPAPGAAPAPALGGGDADEQGSSSADGWLASGSDRPSPSPDAGLAASPDLLATLTSLGERLLKVEQEVAELRAALAAPAAGGRPNSSGPRPGPEPALQDRPSQEWS